MIEAHAKREGERNDLLDTIQRKLANLVEEHGFLDDQKDRHRFYFAAAFVLMKYLFGGEGHVHFPDGSGAYEIVADDFIKKEVLPPLKEFARVPEEERAMIGRLVEELTGSIVNNLRGDLSHQEIHNTQVVFQAPTAMTEVED